MRWVAPILPDFFRAYPEVSIDLHLSDATVDLVGQGFDAALRIAVLPDSSRVARRICAVSPFIVAAPSYLQHHGRPQHPHDLVQHVCLGYAYRARSDVWRFSNDAGDEEVITPAGPLRVTHVDALVPTILARLAIAELPEFIAGEYLHDGRMEVILPDWTLPKGGLYFVTPSARTRPAKVEALSDFMAERLCAPEWSWPRRSAGSAIPLD